MNSICRLTILVPLISVLALAQTDRGAITGTVLDPANAVVPRASISVSNSATGAQYETLTTDTGNYTLPSLPAGIYNLSVSAAGFTKEGGALKGNTPLHISLQPAYNRFSMFYAYASPFGFRFWRFSQSR